MASWATRLLLLFLIATSAAAQAQSAFTAETSSTPPAPAPSALAEVERLAARAGHIFVGRVFAIAPLPAEEGAEGLSLVEIQVEVTQAVRGATPGERFTFTEWAALWQQQPHRYRVGEELLLFLHPAASSGLTSPVEDGRGVVPIRRGRLHLRQEGRAQRLARATADEEPADDPLLSTLEEAVHRLQRLRERPR